MKQINKIISLIGISFLLTGCGNDTLSTMDQHVVVDVEKASKGNLAVEGVYIGQIENTEDGSFLGFSLLNCRMILATSGRSRHRADAHCRVGCHVDLSRHLGLSS